jgi:cytochrome P450
MQLASEMALPVLPMEDPAFAVDPMPYLETARRQHPWLAKCEIGYVVHEYQAMKDLSYMDDKLRTSNTSVSEIMHAKGTRWGRFIDEQIVARSGSEHARIRNSVAASFTPRNVNRYRDVMRQTVSRLLDDWAPKGAFDYVDFASNFPISVMFGLVGAPHEAIPNIRASLEILGLAFCMDPALVPELERSYGVLWDFVDNLIVQREKQGGGNEEEVLNTLIASKQAGQLTDIELRDLLIFIFVAGYDTSKNILTLIMYMMLSRPDDWVRCSKDLTFCRKVVEEMFRYGTVASMYRVVSDEIEYRDIRFPRDAMIIFPLPLAGRDPAIFTDPMKFDPDRDHPDRHIAFGRGMHMCLGQHLARAQIEEGIHVIAQRITKPKLAGELAWRPFHGVWGLRTLPITFTPAKA